ncbi:MAG: hypothetical protein Q9227_002071 [Pyrenula ochraceoflavens]
MAQKCGMPYKRERPHTIHGHAEVAQRSLDSLPLTKRALLNHETPHHFESPTSAPQSVRRAKSEHGSPDLSAVTTPDRFPLSHGLPNLDSPFGTGSPASLPFPSADSYPDSYFTPSSQEVDAPLHSAGPTPSVDWSQFNFPYDQNGTYSTAPSQPPSFASHDWNSHFSHPGIASSPGDFSEPEDPSYPLPDHLQDMTDAASDTDFDAEKDKYRLSAALGDLPGVPIPTTSAPHTEALDIDDCIKNADEATRAMQQQQRNLELMKSSTNSPMSSTDAVHQNRPQLAEYPPTSAVNIPTSMPNSPLHSTESIQQPQNVINPEFSSPLKQEQFPSPPQEQMRESPMGPEHGLTVREAQQYAHMRASNLEQPLQSEALLQPNITNGAEDPMWSYTAPTPSSMSMVDTENSYQEPQNAWSN